MELLEGIEPSNLILTKDALCRLSYSSARVSGLTIIKLLSKSPQITVKTVAAENTPPILTKDALYRLSYSSLFSFMTVLRMRFASSAAESDFCVTF